jgi:hypothetical protein
MKQLNKFLVVYVFSKFDDIDRFKFFIDSYKKNPPGYPHKFLICFKLLNEEKLKLCRSIASGITYKEFIDPINQNDFEFKTMERAVQNYNDYIVLFLISHCRFEKKNWLKIINDSFSDNSYMGFSGSNESIFSSLKFKKFWKVYSYLNQYFNLKKYFQKFPNPHVRGPSFVLKQKDFLDFIKGKKYLNKMDAVKSECGKNSMTNFFANKGYKIFIINSSGKKYNLDNMEKSMTYCNEPISDVLISDRHHRKYQLLSNKEQIEINKKVWANF